jgi:hypothetical protein
VNLSHRHSAANQEEFSVSEAMAAPVDEQEACVSPVSGLRSVARLQPAVGPWEWHEEDYARSEIKWSASGFVRASVDGSECFTMALSHDQWTQIQGLARECALAEAGGNPLGLVNSKLHLGRALTLMESWACEASVSQWGDREAELSALKAEGQGTPANDMEFGVLRLVRARTELWGICSYSQWSRDRAKAFLEDAIAVSDLHGSTDQARMDRWYVKPNGSIWAESQDLLDHPFGRYSLKNLDPVLLPESVPDGIRKSAIEALLKIEGGLSNGFRALPGDILVERYNIIGTPFWKYRAWEPLAGHSTITSGPEGRRLGEVRTRPLPAEIEGLPYGDRRIDAVEDWHLEQYREAYRAIRQAFPEASFGKASDGVIELTFKT